MEDWLIYLIMAVSGTGALLSGKVFKRHTWRIPTLLVCVVVFEIMWLMLSGKYGVEWDSPGYGTYRLVRRVVAIVAGIVFVAISFKISKTED